MAKGVYIVYFKYARPPFIGQIVMKARRIEIKPTSDGINSVF